MPELSFTRVDFRLIHGQVITKWIRLCNANTIVIIDDALYHDPFLLSIYTMAAPPGFKVDVYSVETAIAKWKNHNFSNGKVFLLFKDISTLHRTILQGLPIKRVQIGGVEFSAKRTNVFGTISLDNHDASMLHELAKKDIEIYFQSVPDEASESLQGILKKHNFQID